MLVAIDTATRFASLALWEPGRVLAEHTWQTGNNHTVEMMPSLTMMMERAGLVTTELGAAAVAIGPGSFTGLRIGLSIAKGLAMSLDIPIVGIPTLDILPYSIGHVGLPNWSVIQAGRGRLCYAEYRDQNGAWHRQSGWEVGTIDDLIGHLKGSAHVYGELTQAERETIGEQLGEAIVVTPPAFCLRRAAFLADLAWQRLERGEQDDVVTLSPIYLHQSDNSGSV
jgi:tRNA threonylcarbamoyladenosine biosynthesis protein TsaB